MAGAVAQVAGRPGLWLYAIANGVLAVAVVAVLTAMGWWRKVGFRAPRRPRDLLWFLVPFLPVALNLIPGVEFVDALTVTGLLLLALAVGFVEESVFRGLMLTALVSGTASSISPPSRYRLRPGGRRLREPGAGGARDTAAGRVRHGPFETSAGSADHGGRGRTAEGRLSTRHVVCE